MIATVQKWRAKMRQWERIGLCGKAPCFHRHDRSWYEHGGEQWAQKCSFVGIKPHCACVSRAGYRRGEAKGMQALWISNVLCTLKSDILKKQPKLFLGSSTAAYEVWEEVWAAKVLYMSILAFPFSPITPTLSQTREVHHVHQVSLQLHQDCCACELLFLF